MSITDLIYLSQKSLRSNILRSILTSLGIIIGVSSVITMISIGSGARIEVEQQIERFGSNNLIVRSQSSSNRGVSICLLYTSPSPRDRTRSRMPSSA